MIVKRSLNQLLKDLTIERAAFEELEAKYLKSGEPQKGNLLRCVHNLVEEMPDPNGSVPIRRCVICGKEFL